MPVSQVEHSCPEKEHEQSCQQLHQCRTLDDVFAFYVKIGRAQQIPEAVIARDKKIFYNGAEAVYGLIEGNDVSMTAIKAMLEIHAESRTQKPAQS